MDGVDLPTASCLVAEQVLGQLSMMREVHTRQSTEETTRAGWFITILCSGHIRSATCHRRQAWRTVVAGVDVVAVAMGHEEGEVAVEMGNVVERTVCSSSSWCFL